MLFLKLEVVSFRYLLIATQHYKSCNLSSSSYQIETMYSLKELADFQEDSFEKNQTYDASICIMTKILALMSGRWKPIILHLIKNDINRFGLLQKRMPLISKKVLTNQLRELEADGL